MITAFDIRLRSVPLAVPGSEFCHQIDENTLYDIVDFGDVIRYIAILKSNAQFKIVAQMPTDCNEIVGLCGLGIGAA